MFGKKKKSKKSKPPRKTRKAKATDAAARARQQKMIQMGLGVTVGGLALAVLIVGLIALRNNFWDENVPPVNKVVLGNKPDWMDQATADQICQEILDVASENPTARDLLAKAAAKLSANIWVKQIAPAGVVNNYDGSLIIRCQFRKPLALVSAGGVLVRVDADALVLPDRFLQTSPLAARYKRVLGVVSKKPPAAGQIWDAADVRAAVDLLKLIDGQPFSKEIIEINVSNYNGRRDVSKPHIFMRTNGQAVIGWGKAIGTEGRIEVSHQQKLANLERLFLKYGSLNKLNYADLRGQKVLGKLRDGESISAR